MSDGPHLVGSQEARQSFSVRLPGCVRADPGRDRHLTSGRAITSGARDARGQTQARGPEPLVRGPDDGRRQDGVGRGGAPRERGHYPDTRDTARNTIRGSPLQGSGGAVQRRSAIRAPISAPAKARGIALGGGVRRVEAGEAGSLCPGGIVCRWTLDRRWAVPVVGKRTAGDRGARGAMRARPPRVRARLGVHHAPRGGAAGVRAPERAEAAYACPRLGFWDIWARGLEVAVARKGSRRVGLRWCMETVGWHRVEPADESDAAGEWGSN